MTDGESRDFCHQVWVQSKNKHADKLIWGFETSYEEQIVSPGISIFTCPCFCIRTFFCCDARTRSVGHSEFCGPALSLCRCNYRLEPSIRVLSLCLSLTFSEERVNHRLSSNTQAARSVTIWAFSGVQRETAQWDSRAASLHSKLITTLKELSCLFS